MTTWISTVLVLVMLSSHAAFAQDSRDHSAVDAALRHVRRDLPKGAIALQAEGLPRTANAARLATALAAQLRAKKELADCSVLDNGRVSCKLRGVGGAMGIETLERLSSDRMRVVVWTQVQLSNDQRSWIYLREYAVELKATPAGWLVLDARLLSES